MPQTAGMPAAGGVHGPPPPTGAVPAPLAPPAAAAAAMRCTSRVEREWHWRLKVEMFGVLASAAMQIVYLCHQWRSANPQDNMHVAVVVLYHVLILRLMVGKEPTLYRQYRTPIYAIMRPLGYLSPSVRSSKAGASLLLNQQAAQGAWGSLLDLKRLMLVTLFVQSVSTVLAANNSGYCTTPLLTDPLTQRRISKLAGIMDVLSLPFSAAVPMPPPHAQPQRQCEAMLAWLQLLFAIILPMLVLTRTEWDERELRERTVPPPASPLLGRLQQRVQRAIEASDWALFRLCRLSTSAHFPVALWLLLGLTWSACIGLYGL